MKILELRFKNLNSLYGEWFIDFTHHEYSSQAIFALTGPTGAGKSTILDAICLALYGATPRLKKITESSNEIMSRQTAECYAEVVFESQGSRFRCHWEQRRARKKISGVLQGYTHQIADADTGMLIEDQKSIVPHIVEEKIGMDFKRFTQSILLAQGDFDSFLKADVEQKSKILEQMTGTEIYSEISRRIYKRQQEERTKLNFLQAETSGIVILEVEQEKEIQEELELQQKHEDERAVQVSQIEKAIAWVNVVDSLKKEIFILDEKDQKLHREMEAFKPERWSLAQAQRAAELEGAYGKLTTLRSQHSNDQTTLKIEEKKLPALDHSFKQEGECLKVTEQAILKAKENLKQAQPVIQQVRLLDQKLMEQQKAISEVEESCIKNREKIDSDKQFKIKEQKKLDQTMASLIVVEVYLSEHAHDKWLIGGLESVEEQLNTLVSKQGQIEQKRTEENNAVAMLQQITKKLEACTKHVRVRKQAWEDAVKKHQEEKEALSKLLGDRSLREYRTEKENLLREKSFLTTIATLEEHRSQLEAGKSCPLCGSKEHPFANASVPTSSETDRKIETLTKFIQSAEDLEKVIQGIVKAENTAWIELNESEKKQAAADHDQKLSEKSLSDLKKRLISFQVEFQDLKSAVFNKLRPWGIEETAGATIVFLLESLKNRLKKWQDQVKEKEKGEKQVSELKGELNRWEAVIETQISSLAEKQKNLDLLKKACENTGIERRKLYENKHPEDEEFSLKEAIHQAEQAGKAAKIAYDKRSLEWTSTKTRIDSLKERTTELVLQLKSVESDFVFSLQTAGFLSETAFLEARLSIEKRHAFLAKAKQLDEELTALKTRREEAKARLEKEFEKQITNKTLEELELQHKELEAALKGITEAVISLRHKLSENIAAKERIQKKREVMEAQKKECQRWEKLHGLIGSADGKKYRNFAQGLTFELMVSHANRQLEKMSGRYSLIRSDEQPLELNVVDDYQAGEIRSIKNLSGGESFIVSLALALGLSKMASKKVRVDSLFLDEGFETLDEEALDIALNHLASLREDGKLIGLISHVPSMKERISTQIQITPQAAGRSRLSGPGCSKI